MTLKHQSKSAFQSYLANVPGPNVARSTFNRSHTVKTAIYDDVLAPIFLQEILPGDTINLGVNSFIRMNPTITPVMDNVWNDTHFFFVPNRLVWDNFQKFMGEQTDPGDSIDYLVPKITPPGGGFALYSLADYFGLPILEAFNTNEPINSLPFRAYSLIFNEWYRDQNLQDSIPVPKDDGPDVIGSDILNVLQLSNKRHDYITSGLPWPQKGTAVPIPISGTVPVIRDSTSTANSLIRISATGALSGSMNLASDASGNLTDATTGTVDRQLDPNGTMLANLTAHTAGTINALRQAYNLQCLYERDARGGTRYTEIIRAHFGVVSADSRLQRPEFLGGSSNMVVMNPLAQTSEPTAQSPQGNLAGNGTLISTNTRFSKSFTEHGFVIGITRFRGDLSYSQGLDRFWSRRTKHDYFWPDLQTMGEQAVLNKEVIVNSSSVDDFAFSYMPRYDEYRFQKNYLTANMRPAAGADSVDYWHLSEEFAGSPVLADLIQSETPFDRVLQVPTQPTFLCDYYFDLKHSRPMATHAIPGLAGRF